VSAGTSPPQLRTAKTARSERRLLLVEDDVKLCKALARGLEHEGYEVHLAHTGDDALARSGEHDYDAMVLDLMLPGIDGFDVCRSVRERDEYLPVVMLTALGEVSDRVRGLDLGADDYLVKPFSLDELLARLRAVIRRGPSERPAPVRVEGVRADPLNGTVSWESGEAVLTPREFELFVFLLRRPGIVVSRAQLLSELWGEKFEGSPNVVDVYVGYVRRKLTGSGAPALRTVRGEGFVLDPVPNRDQEADPAG
jgi:two-component system OmpR family response regulator